MNNKQLRLIDRSATVRVEQLQSLSDLLFRQALYNAPNERLRIIASFYVLAKRVTPAPAPVIDDEWSDEDIKWGRNIAPTFGVLEL